MSHTLVFKYFPKVFDFFQIFFQIHCQYQHFFFTVTCNACQTDYRNALQLHPTVLITDEGFPHGPAAVTTSQRMDDHRSISPFVL